MSTQINVKDALLDAEAALELAIQRILKRDPGHAVHVTSEAKALVSVRRALSQCQGCAVQQGTHVPMGAVVTGIAEQGNSMSQYSSKDDMLKAVMAENEQLKAELAAAQQGVPEGWALVPVEPQDAQQAAGATAIRFDTTLINKMWTANKVYREMVAAAPQSPATHPTTQGLDADTQHNADIGAAVMRACKDLPEGAEIQIYLERGAGTVHMTDWDGNEFDHFNEDHEDFACQINAATDGAIAAKQVAAQAKQAGV